MLLLETSRVSRLGRVKSEAGIADIIVEAAKIVFTLELPAGHSNHLVNRLTIPAAAFINLN
jgi:hypothetical protein